MEQIGLEKWDEIYSSKEYADLVEANRKTFNWVDKAKTDSCKAYDVDRSNYERCKARNVLQMKFLIQMFLKRNLDMKNMIKAISVLPQEYNS